MIAHLTKQNRFVLLALTVPFISALIWVSVGSALQPRMVQFVGLTNDIVNPRVDAFNRLYAPGNEAIQWLSAGTNVGRFRISNQRPYPIEILGACTLYFKGGPPVGHYLPLLNAPRFSGIYLRPSQTATVEVPLLAHSGCWKTQFEYQKIRSTRLFRWRSFSPLGKISSAWIEPWAGLPDGGAANGSRP